MDIQLICGTKNFLCTDLVHLNFSPLRLTTEVAILNHPLFSSALQSVDGNRTRELYKYPFFTALVNYTGDEPIVQYVNRFGISMGNNVGVILNSLWFIRDNSITAGDLLAWNFDKKYLLVHGGARDVTSATGGTFDTSYTLEEVNLAKNILEKADSISPKTENPVEFTFNADTQQHTGDLINNRSYDENTPIQRALLFLFNARTTPQLTHKIAQYIPILECLFVYDAQEITHKVAERTALYLGGSGEQMKKDYNAIKKAYTIRSRYFHGDTLQLKKDRPEKEQLQEISHSIDDVIRRTLYKVIMEDSKLFLLKYTSVKDLYFNNLIFGIETDIDAEVEKEKEKSRKGNKKEK